MSNLHPYIRNDLDVLFVALNPPAQSHSNGHWFSGKSSRFFYLLHQSGLVIQPVEKESADEIVFGSTELNHNRCSFGVIDLVHNVVETNSVKVSPTKEHVVALLEKIRRYKPRNVCVVHYKVRRALQRHGQLEADLVYGYCGPVLKGCGSCFFVNYFPNGNNVSDTKKMEIFRALKRRLPS